MPQSHYPFKKLQLICTKNTSFPKVPQPKITMKTLSLCSNLLHPQLIISKSEESLKLKRGSNFTLHASKSSGFSLKSIMNSCQTCKGQGAVECAGCKGTGKNKKNGNIFERWKCIDCQRFGLKSCPVCGKGGLTPEQRGER